MTTLALFGTSADPPTAGHQQILRQLSYQYDQVIAWASDNPMKTDQTPLVHRAAMLKLLINDIEPHRSNLKCRQDLSYPRTIHTIEQVQKEWPEASLTLVVGSDLIQQLPHWYHVQLLLEQVHLLVVPRPNYAIQSEAINQLRRLGADVEIANFQGLPVSSTAYRQAQQQQPQQPIQAQQSDDSTTQQPLAESPPHPSPDDSVLSHTFGITPPIHDYIMRERLYDHH